MTMELCGMEGAYGAMPAAAFGSLETWRTDDGRIGVEHIGSGLLAMSLALFKQRDPEIITVRKGLLVIAGVDRAGEPVELVYRAVGMQVSDFPYLEANEGGAVLLELVT